MRSLNSIQRTSETPHGEFKLEKISVYDFTTAIKEFVDENFRGAMTVENAPVDSGYITASPIGFAHFLKLLLNEIYGKGMLKAKIATVNGRVVIEIKLPNTSLNTDRLLSAAICSGFSVEREDAREIILFATTAKEKILSIYAVNFSKFKRYLNEIFFI